MTVRTLHQRAGMRRGRKPKPVRLQDGAMVVSFRCPTDVVLGIEREVLRETQAQGLEFSRTDLIVMLLRSGLQARAAK